MEKESNVMGEISENPLAGKIASLLESNGAAKRSKFPIVFENLSVIGSGNKAEVAPTAISPFQSALTILNPQSYKKSAKPERTLLSSWNGVVNPGEMLLGRVSRYPWLLNLWGKSIDASAADSVRVTFCAEDDDHFPTLLVEETLRFAVESSWPRDASKSAKHDSVRSLADLVGLGHVLRTRALATHADVMCLDNPTNGLDSSTALEFVEMMREYTRQSGCATIMSIYQGSDAMVPMFDKVAVINQGHQVFYGKAQEAKPHFEKLGHKCPPTTTITDFLTSMSANKISAPITSREPPPSTTKQLKMAFESSSHYQDTLREALAAKSMPLPLGSFGGNTFELPLWHQIRLCTNRQFRVLVTNYHNWLIEAGCAIVQSIAIGTLFRDQPRETKSFFILACSLFFCALVPSLQAMSEFGNTFATRSLVARQKQYGFYRPMSYALGLVTTDMIWKIVTISYNIPQYFLTGFQYDAGKFFTWFLVLYIENMALSMIFRTVGILSKSMSWAVLPVGVIFNLGVIYTGLYIPPPQMQGWLFWIKYINPLYYSWESIIVNEFSNLEYQCSDSDLAPSGPNYVNFTNQVCAVKGAVPGQASVLGSAFVREQYGLDASHLWRNVGINIAIFLFFAVCTGVGMELHKPAAGTAATVLYRKQTWPADRKGKNRLDVAETDIESGSSDETQTFTHGISPTEGNTHQMETHSGRTLAWDNLCLRIETDGKEKVLLDNLSGSVHPNQLTALMGVSGAGKTTLLNTLAGRIDFGKVSGQLSIDGSPLPKSFTRFMGYVQQQDIHLPSQTVREALQMTARLRRPSSVSDEEKDGYVEKLISLLELDDLAEALVGFPGAGLTLEQRRRVSIGVELAALPEVLFLDEPTSGLDGQSALHIVRLLRKLADAGQTILSYDGPLGDGCSAAVEYFQNQSHVGCGEKQNPAEYILDIVGAGSRSTNTIDWASTWDHSKASTSDPQQKGKSEPQDIQSSFEMQSRGRYAVSFLSQLSVVLRRAWLFTWRDPDYFAAKLFLNLSNGLVNGLSYLNSPDTSDGMYNRIFSAFVAVIVGPPLALQTEVRFFAFRDIFLLRDKDSMSYSWIVMVLSSILVELPFALITGLVYWLVWYYPVGYFTSSDRAGYSFLMFELFHVFVHSLAQLVASVMPSLESSFVANGFCFMFINTLSGILSPKPLTPAGWRWYYDLNPLFYFSEGTAAVLTHGLEITCSDAETFEFMPPSNTTCIDYAYEWLENASGYVMNQDDMEICRYCRYKDGDSYLKQYDWTFGNRWRDVGVFLAFIAFNYLGVMALIEIDRLRQRVQDLEAEREQRPSQPAAISPALVSPPSSDSHNSTSVPFHPVSEKWKGTTVEGIRYGPFSLQYFSERISRYLEIDADPRVSLADFPLWDTTTLAECCDGVGKMAQDHFLDLHWLCYHVNYPAIDESDFRKLYASLWHTNEASSTRRPDPLVDIVLAMNIQYALSFMPQDETLPRQPAEHSCLGEVHSINAARAH
uniref:ABC transporter domain-containing protein n=1 Tax=Bionectria ochroleuca TaxID=29856 RepID=A0A8H7NHW9_BIOOC